MNTFGRMRYTQLVAKSMEDRRAEPRFPETEPVLVTILDGSNRAYRGLTLDIAETGLSFAIAGVIEEGKPLRIELAEAVVLGEARYCRVLVDHPREYAVGVSIEHVCFGWGRVYERAAAASGAAVRASLIA